jgi:NAD(P)-dependent dehydrogenase (short-subunit alcohol dehydrogenase family)
MSKIKIADYVIRIPLLVKDMSMKSTKQIFISGALGGLGEATIDLLVNKGWHVFASDINPEILIRYDMHISVTPLVVDVTKTHSIDEAYEFVAKNTDGLDALLTMAGILKIGSVAEVNVEVARKALDINLFGAYHLNQRFLSLILKRKGRILTMSSEVGIQMAAPFNGIYSMSKHAMEAYSDALRRELAFLGIKVIKIQPGPFKTMMTKHAEAIFIEAENNSVYFKHNIKKGIPYLPKVYKNASEPIHVAKTIMKALTAKNPKIAYLIKPDLLRLMLDKLPVRWADKLIKMALS